MATVIVGNPGIGGVNATSKDDRYAGVNSVRNDGVVGTRHESALQVVQHPTDAPSYIINFNVAATAALDIVTIRPSTANKVYRLRRIVLVNPGSATAAIFVDLQLGVATSVGSGGSAALARAVDVYARAGAGVTGGPDTDNLAGSSTGDTVQAVGFTALYNPLVTVSVPAAAAAFTPQVIYDARDPLFKALTGGTSGGQQAIVLRTPAIGAGATGFRGYAEFTVDDA